MGTMDGKTALVTGGSRGIGRAICQALAAQGADVVLHYNRNLAAAEETAASIRGEVRLVQQRGNLEKHPDGFVYRGCC
jgi:NAD(P)-dependent dehydrogenase (short-subunit alcohol dehydrogenase family)